MVKVLAEGSLRPRYGEFFIVRPVMECLPVILVGQDYFCCNCNGDREDAAIAQADSEPELRLWAAANGLEILENVDFPRYSMPGAFR